jgi:hypothetical protein
LKALGANVTITAKGIACASVPLEALDTKVVATPTAFKLDALTLNLGRAGALTTTMNLTHGATPRLSIATTAERLNLEELVPQLKQRGAALPVAINANLNAAGGTTRALASSLAGVVDVNGDSGRLQFGSLLGNVVALERLLNGQVAGAGGNSDSVDNLAAKLVFNRGVGTFEKLNIGTGGGALQVAGQGAINLPAWLIDLTLTPQVNTTSAISVPVEIKGPLTAPAIAASPAAVQKLSGRLAGEALKLLGVDKENAKGLGGALGGVLSGQQGAGQAAGELLGNFLAPKPKPAAPSPTVAPAAAPAAAEPTPVAPLATPEPTPVPEPAPAAPTAADAVGELINILGQ